MRAPILLTLTPALTVPTTASLDEDARGERLSKVAALTADALARRAELGCTGRPTMSEPLRLSVPPTARSRSGIGF